MLSSLFHGYIIISGKIIVCRRLEIFTGTQLGAVVARTSEA